MPRRQGSYILTAAAARDFCVARHWSSSHWGDDQTKRNFRRLHDAAEYIAKHQQAITPRDDLTANTKLGVHPVGEHYIVYAPIDDRLIAIVALIRQTRDVPAILETNSFQIRRQLDAALRQFDAKR